MYNGHLLDTETYVGGHVEALESGVFRSDIATGFHVTPEKVQEVRRLARGPLPSHPQSWCPASCVALCPPQLIDNVDEALRYAITVEEKRDMSTILNYEEEKAKLVARLEDLRDKPNRFEGTRTWDMRGCLGAGPSRFVPALTP